jgi:hypothetical protein
MGEWLVLKKYYYWTLISYFITLTMIVPAAVEIIRKQDKLKLTEKV